MGSSNSDVTGCSRRLVSVRNLMLVMTMVATAMNMSVCSAQLSLDFYDKSCPQALTTIKKAVSRAIASERRMAASLIRLHFHDCFVQGCDASLLLVNATGIVSEQDAFQNAKSVRGFEVVDAIKSAVEKVCPGVVSCADILAVAARDSSVYVGGPTWSVKLGRRDSTTANKDLAGQDLPIAFNDLDNLIAVFARQGLSVRDMVALSGSHTIGLAQCATFRDRIYNESNIDSNFARMRQRRCPSATGNGDKNTAPLDPVTPQSFDNSYFKNLLQKKGLLHSDQVLFGDGASTDDIVVSYSKDRTTFYADFAAAMVKMADIKPLTGPAGEVRKTCSVVNK